MSGGSDTHFTILGNLFATLGERFRASPAAPSCPDESPGQRGRHRVLPDVFVTCDPRDRAPEGQLARSIPSSLPKCFPLPPPPSTAAASSKSTSAFPALREYLLIEQDRPMPTSSARTTKVCGCCTRSPGGTVELQSLSLTPPGGSVRGRRIPGRTPVPWPMPSPGSAPG